MIISRTPLRISFCGGGSDFEDHYKNNGGSVVSTTIDKYIYVGVNKKFGGHIRVRYSKNETVDNLSQLEHNIAREALRITGINRAIEIEITSDIPSQGSGLGSSSALAVGLLNALYRYKGYNISPKELAEKATHLEIDILKSPIGKQDQYSVAFGGLNYIEFSSKGVTVESLYKEAYGDNIMLLQEATMLFYLHNRNSNDILLDHKNGIASNKYVLDFQNMLSHIFKRWLTKEDIYYNYEYMGKLISDSWECKKVITPLTTSKSIDEIFRTFMNKGALGGKLCGAGGGGFLLVLCRRELQQEVISALSSNLHLDFKFEKEGSKIIYAD